jgi:hypothetical protein
MNKCPKCGHKWPDEERAEGGKARWQGVPMAERATLARKAAKARWTKEGIRTKPEQGQLSAPQKS